MLGMKKTRYRHLFHSTGFYESQLRNTNSAYLLWWQDDEDCFLYFKACQRLFPNCPRQTSQSSVCLWKTVNEVSVAKTTNEWLYDMVRKAKQNDNITFFREQEEKILLSEWLDWWKKYKKMFLNPQLDMGFNIIMA